MRGNAAFGWHMRRTLIPALLAALALLLSGSPAAAANPVAAHQAAAPAAPAAPAPAHQATIIPGSPLAVLTGASAPTPPPKNPQIDTASPFGSGNLGLSLTSVIGAGTARTLDAFVSAMRQSTQLLPVATWAQTLVDMPARRGHALDILRGLLIAVLPALLADLAIRFGLARPRAAIVARAGRALPPPAPAGEALADAEAGETEKRPRHRRETFMSWSRRIGRALLHLLLSLLPVVGFALVSGVILGTGVVATRQARLAVVVVCNAYLLCRLALEILRFFLAPKAPPLRLIAASNARASWIVAWVRLVLFTGALGYAVISVFEILSLPRNGMLVLNRLVVLAVHIEVALMLWRCRHVVGRWIAGSRQATGFVADLRRRLSFTWIYLALFYILALWIAWAGGVHNAFGLLLRIVLVLMAALFIGRMTWTGSTWLLDHLLAETDAQTARRNAFYARARAYDPLIHAVLRILIVLGCVVIILEGWGLHVLPWLLHDKLSRGLTYAFFSVLITVAVALALWELSMALINGRIDRLAASGQTRQASRLRTLLPMLQATIGVSIGIVAGLIALSKIGVNAAPLLAGASVLGIAIGFGSQKLVQDIITGLFLLLEDAMQVGDVINLAGMTGTVERLSIRTIRLRGGDGSMNIIPFSAVTTVTNMTRDFGYAQISIQVGYEEDLPHVYAILEDIGKAMRSELRWGAMMRDDLQIFGLDQFGASALVITGQIRTGPGQHWAVRREFNARVKQRFEAEHIDMPYAYLAPPPAPPSPEEQAKPETPTETEPPAEQPAAGNNSTPDH